MRNFSLLIVLLFFGLQSLSQPYTEFTPLLKEAHHSIFTLEFSKARDLIQRQELATPDNYTCFYLEGALTAVQLFISDEEKRFDNQVAELELIEQKLAQLEEINPWRNLFLAEILVSQAILNGKYRNNFTAAWQFYKAYQLLVKNQEQHPDFVPNKVPLGVLFAAIGSLPEDYRSMASMLGIKGDVGKGLEMLEDAYQFMSTSRELGFMKNYAGFVYCYVNYQLGGAQTAQLPSQLGLNVSESSFLVYLQTKILREQGQGEKALTYFPKADLAYNNFPYLLYLEGKTALGIDNARAEKKLKLYLDNAPNGTYIKSSNRYLAWISMMEGDLNMARVYQQKVLTEGDDYTGADRQALSEVRRGMNRPLIEARIYFDAGKTKEALAVLEKNQHCCESPSEKQEYFYRKGRVEQKLGLINDAQISFIKALSFSPEQDQYAGANSALQLAYIKANDNERIEALRYFKEALKYDDFPFYEGIHQRAKAGIENLRK